MQKEEIIKEEIDKNKKEMRVLKVSFLC